MSSSRFPQEQKDTEWYDLFSRGARDWLRHNEKVREAVRENLPDLLSGSDTLTGDTKRKVQVPVRLLEHYRFRLRRSETETGVGQGDVKPGDVLRPNRTSGTGEGGGGNEDGEIRFLVEFELDEIVDWLWEELELPNLEPRPGAIEEEEPGREGWDRRGVPSRLDRRRTIKEAIKRRAIQPEGPSFTNEDLRFRQLVRRMRPVAQALVFFGLDASSSMSERDRKLAKSFFFWVLQGLRRQYNRIEIVFIAHTVEAWEFTEDEFFRVTAQGGTVASTAFSKAIEIVGERYDPGLYNIYLFYASDGENFPEDRRDAMQTLLKLGTMTSFMGYVETAPHRFPGRDTEIAELFKSLPDHGIASGIYRLDEEKDVMDAIRLFFTQQVE